MREGERRGCACGVPVRRRRTTAPPARHDVVRSSESTSVPTCVRAELVTRRLVDVPSALVLQAMASDVLAALIGTRNGSVGSTGTSLARGGMVTMIRGFGGPAAHGRRLAQRHATTRRRPTGSAGLRTRWRRSVSVRGCVVVQASGRSTTRRSRGGARGRKQDGTA